MAMVFVGILAVLTIYEAVEAQLQSQARTRREASYQIELRSYRERFHPGMTRLATESNLRAQGMAFQEICCDEGSFEDRVQVGREPAPWYCNYNDVYLAFHFIGAPIPGNPPQQDDVLRRIELVHRLEQCL